MRVMGISPAHDSSVAVIEDGKVLSFFKEERLTRHKRDSLPIKSVMCALEYKPDAVVIANPQHNDPSIPFIEAMVGKYANCKSISYADKHHLAHASLAFYNSGFDQALTFIIDRNGSVYNDFARESDSVYRCAYPCTFEPLYKNYWLYNMGADADEYNVHRNASHPTADIVEGNNPLCTIDRLMSIVKVYETATSLIGQSPLENGKVMGLSAYGQRKPFKNLFDEEGKPNDNLFIHGKFVEPIMTTAILREHFTKLTREVTKENYQFYADYSYQVQKQTQDVVLNLVKKYVEQTGIRKVCITGGYGLNVVTNEYLIKNLPDVEFYFEPLADDSGNSIGAAMHYYREQTQDSKINKITTTFFHGVERPVEEVGITCTVDDIAQLLVDQKVVAVFNGLAEAGPRALGNRSILFDARNKDAKDIVNKTKKREWYRPFAAMILESQFGNYFDTHGLKSSEYMTVSFQCTRPDEIPGVCHVDNSCRIQTVNDSIPHIFTLLNKFNEKTSCPVLLNTSFNMAGEALVETQEDAIKTFNNSDIDALWFPQIGKVIMKGVK